MSAMAARERTRQVLLVEDNPADAELTAVALQEGHFVEQVLAIKTFWANHRWFPVLPGNAPNVGQALT